MTRILAIAALLPFFLLTSVSPASAQGDVQTNDDKPLVSIVTTDEAADDQFVGDEPILLPAPTFDDVPSETTGATDTTNAASDGDAGFTVNITEITNADDPSASASTDVGPASSTASQKFRAQLNQHTIDVLKWQLQTSERILQLVMFMSLAGILFAGYQLWHSLNTNTRRMAAADKMAQGDADAAPASTDSTISFGDGKFEVTSPIVGILILVISLGALYFFLTFVYTVDLVTIPTN